MWWYLYRSKHSCVIRKRKTANDVGGDSWRGQDEPVGAGRRSKTWSFCDRSWRGSEPILGGFSLGSLWSWIVRDMEVELKFPSRSKVKKPCFLPFSPRLSFRFDDFYAKSLAESLSSFNPTLVFVLVLCDDRSICDLIWFDRSKLIIYDSRSCTSMMGRPGH